MSRSGANAFDRARHERLSDGDPVVAGEVGANLDVRVTGGVKQVTHRGTLIGPDLEHEPTACGQMFRRTGDQRANVVEPVRAGEQRRVRFP